MWQSTDETPVYRQLQPSKGNVVMLVQKLDRSCYARVPLRERRGQSTLLGCIVDTPELQSSMPQFILTNDTKLTRLEKAHMLSLPLPLRWVKGTSGWMSAGVLRQLITAIRKAIRTKKPNAEILLYMDCASIHTARAVLQHCSVLGIHVCLILGGLTYLCQPLDSHVFASLKRKLSEDQEIQRANDPTGTLPPGEWIHSLSRSIQQVLVDRQWSAAFGANGMLANWSTLRRRVGEIVQPHLPLPLRLPTEEELDCLLGRKRVFLGNDVFRSSKRLAERACYVLPKPLVRLPSGMPARVSSSSVAASGSGFHRLAPGSLAGVCVDEDDTVRATRSGQRY